jgi:hypothetical protein
MVAVANLGARMAEQTQKLVRHDAIKGAARSPSLATAQTALARSDRAANFS